MTLEPGNLDLQARTQDVRATRQAGKPTVPATLGLEKRTNPFLRPQSSELRNSLGMQNASDVDVFGETRKRKDNF